MKLFYICKNCMYMKIVNRKHKWVCSSYNMEIVPDTWACDRFIEEIEYKIASKSW